MLLWYFYYTNRDSCPALWRMANSCRVRSSYMVSSERNSKLPDSQAATSASSTPPPNISSLPDRDEIAAAMASIDLIAGWLENTGLPSAAIAQWKYNCLASTFPALGNVAESAKSLIGTTMPVPDSGMNVTEVATILSESCQTKIKPADVNKALVELGLQIRKEKERIWELTEAGSEYAQAFLATSKTSSWSGAQIKWFKSVLPLLENYFQSIAAQTGEPENQQIIAETPNATSTNLPKLTEAREFWFIEERAKHLGFKVNANQLIHIQMYASDAYKERHGQPPSKQAFKKSQADAYPVEDVDILDLAINKLMSRNNGTATKQR